MRSARPLALGVIVSLFAGCAGSGTSVLRCIPIVCSFVGAPPPAPPAPAAELPPPPPPPPAAERIVLRGVNFAFDSAELDAASAVVLDVAAETLNNRPEARVRVEGHTDAIGSEAYNQGLSQRRAESVGRYLVGEGVAASRLETRGYGESRPIASNASAEGRALNRRVELNVVE